MRRDRSHGQRGLRLHVGVINGGSGSKRLPGRTPLALPSATHTVQAGLTTDQKAGGSSPPGRTTCGNSTWVPAIVVMPMIEDPRPCANNP
jgi:hypothetical protein